MIVQRALLQALEPPPNLTVSEWADEFRVLSAEASAEPGRWDTSRAPYQRGIMDAINDPLTEDVVVMSSAQIGKSECLCNMIGYTIDLDPGPILLIQPTLEMAEAFSKDRLDPMLRDSPTLRAKVRDARRDASNTIRHKTFPGGHITLAGANSPAGLASRPIRFVLADEVDRWDPTKEGDPLALAKKRTTTFWNKKHLVVSTPTIKGLSRIEAQYLESDQRRCYVACPHCRERFAIEWQHVKFDGNDPETARIECPTCKARIDESGRAEMLRDPEWRATEPFRGIAGFHIWEAYSPWRKLADIVADFLEAKKATDTLQVFVNTSLGETWEEQGEQAEGHVLLARRRPYPCSVPDGAVCLTMGVDVQDDRLETLVVGWGLGEECWVIEARQIPGDPQRAEPWEQLDSVLNAGYEHESGALLHIQSACIDTGGHRTQYAYDYVTKRQHQRVYGVKGIGGPGIPLVSAPSAKRTGSDRRKFPLFTIGTDQVKGLIYSRLKITSEGPGFVHLPIAYKTDDGEYRDGVDEEFIAQLTSEKLVTKHKAGVPVKTWVQTRARNEALDMMVYATAALRLLRPNLPDMAAKLKATPEIQSTAMPAPKKAPWIQPRRGWLR